MIINAKPENSEMLHKLLDKALLLAEARKAQAEAEARKAEAEGSIFFGSSSVLL